MRGARILVAGLATLAATPVAAQAAAPPDRSTTSRLDDRRFVVSGTRAYEVGTQAGRYPAMGFHTRGEMGGVWSAPLKLLDGIWFGVDGQWLGPAERFTSGAGQVQMEIPGRDGLRVERTDVVPDGRRGLLIRLRLSQPGPAQTVALQVDAHSELMSAYPWGETTPSQSTYNLPDTAAYDGKALVFGETGTPPAPNAMPHDWGAAVGSTLKPTGGRTGPGFRGPQDPAVICPASTDKRAKPPKRCDDTAYGEGAGGRLTYDVPIPANGSADVWFAVAGSESGTAGATQELAALLADPGALVQAKLASRAAVGERTRLTLPGDPRLAEAIAWSQQNLADSVQSVPSLALRRTEEGKKYPAPLATTGPQTFLGAGFPDYPWLFGTDGEYTTFAAAALGQFEPMEAHLRALRDVSERVNGTSGKVVHEVVTDGSVYFGTLADKGNTDETAKFPSAVATLWRWSGDTAFLRDLYPFAVRNMRYVTGKLDADGDGWPEGLGNVEREGMGAEKLDNAVYTIRGLYDLADLARARHDGATRSWASRTGRRLRARFEQAWWYPKAPGYADSLDGKDNTQSYQRHWIGLTPVEALLPGHNGATTESPLAAAGHARQALQVHERPCYTGPTGLYHTGKTGCDGAPKSPDELHAFTLNTAIAAVAEGAVGRLRAQARYTGANAAQQLPGTEQPGAMPEIASPNPLDGSTLDRPFYERPQVLQAWGAYGTAWPVVHQQLGVRPDVGRGRLAVVPQVPGLLPIAGASIRIGATGSVDVAARRRAREWSTTVTARGGRVRRLEIGVTLPARTRVGAVRLNGRRVPARIRDTARGREVVVTARVGSEQRLVVAAGR